MTLLAKKFCGSITHCQCGAILAYNAKDIYGDKYIYCPICKSKIEVRFHDVAAGEIIDENRQTATTK